MPAEENAPAPLRFCGIDTGESCAVAVRELFPPRGEDARGLVRWLYYEAPPIEELPGRCERIFDALGVEGMVIDGGPHTEAARRVYDLIEGGGFIWRHTEGEMSVKRVPFLGVERRHVRMNREELLNRLTGEFREDAVRWPTPRDEKEEALLNGVEVQLMNLRKKRVRRARGEEIDVYERGENHFGFACAKLAEELAVSEGILAPPAGGTVPPPEDTGYRRLSRGR